MRRNSASVSFVVLILFFLIPSERLFAASAEQVEGSIAKAKQYLYSRQQDGNWEVARLTRRRDSSRWTRGSGAALPPSRRNALLASGEKPTKPEVAKALAFLQKAEIRGIYALGLRAQVWALAPDFPRANEAMKRDTEILVKAAENNSSKGFYAYTLDDAFYHHSVSQYGVLGVWAGARTGADAPHSYWKDVEDGWRKHPAAGRRMVLSVQARRPIPRLGVHDCRRRGHPFHHAGLSPWRRGPACKGNLINDAIENGLNWMTTHFCRGAGQLHLVRRRAHRRRERAKYFGEHGLVCTPAPITSSKPSSRTARGAAAAATSRILPSASSSWSAAARRWS